MRFLTLLGFVFAASGASAQVITSLLPPRNARSVARSTAVAATLSAPVAVGAGSALHVFSAQAGGHKAGTATATGNVISLTPTVGFKPGEVVRATLTAAGSAVPQVWQFTAAAGQGAGVFRGVSNPVIGSSTSDVEVADLDNDSDLDLLVVDVINRAITVTRNLGGGTFAVPAPALVLPPNYSPQELAIGDLDNDGDLDLAISTYFSTQGGNGAITIGLNDGQGNFTTTAPATLSTLVGNQPLGIEVGDIDADGDLDILTASYAGNSVSVCRNNGSAGFTLAATVAVGDSPRDLALGDLDSDGDLDFVTANGGGTPNASVRLNDGSGLFTAPAQGGSLSTGLQSIGVALGDVDRDGDLDALVTNPAGGSVSVCLNNGAALLTPVVPAVVLGLVPAATPFDVALGDIDGDGDLDGLAVNAYGNAPTVRVMTNDGLGGFSLGRDAVVALSATPNHIALGDLDGDGDLDLATDGISGSTTFNVRFNQLTTATQQPASAAPATIWPNPVGRGTTLHLLTGTTAAAGTITVQNLLGQIVHQQAFQQAKSDITTAGLAPGLYLLTVQAPGQPARTQHVVVE
ncbi:T9SS type A sorting domain-containing protein [Hymenobacter sp. ASUV-10]|uniref:T9SS type A sorting domain-containing protein n=1 Tax=Hymenobacter aranciens TaxID=3063996 RepID=A0ABT9BJ15_9BACT|nr:T9SS type A sorting domain-containing protein [Hymenobacter sp. ASUV-10]MDO7876508.1 T9SS type A sorting domain-containing protein [Hymenobacter sp. ASUV-10]